MNASEPVTGRASVLCRCASCGAEMSEISQGIDTQTMHCFVSGTCDNGHERRVAWRPGCPPPAEAMPFLVAIGFGG